MGMSMRGGICPKCRNEMLLQVQSEKIGNRVEVVYLYRCIACKRSFTLEVIEIKQNTDRIIVTKSRMKVS